MNEQPIHFHTFAHFARTPHLVQGVAGRLGGVSGGHLAALNLSLVVQDDPRTVLENRRRLAGALGIPADRLLKSRQVHSADILVVGEREVSAGALGPHDSALVGDGLLTNTPEIYLFMTFADCVPVLLHDPIKGVVGLVHAGWKGTVAKVAQRAVVVAGEAFGSRPEDILVGIGPSIGPCCYAVGPDVSAVVVAAFPGCPDLLAERDGGTHLDLWRANACQLEAVGVPAANVEVAGVCTACHTDLYFSHRRERGRTGRFGAVIGLRGH
ncbi:MAG: peptidoglycan editing factor PgeF [Chloroflexota bacterium]